MELHHQQAANFSSQKEKLDSIRESEINRKTGLPDRLKKAEFLYDSYGNLTQETRSVFDVPSQKWQPDHRTDFVFSAIGYLEKQTDFKYDKTAQTFRLEKEEAWGHDSVGNPDFHYYFDENGGYRHEFDFALSKHLTEWRVQFRDSANAGWENHSRTRYLYPPHVKISIRQFWDKNQTKWVNNLKISKLFDPFGNLHSEFHQLWDAANETFRDDRKRDFFYDGNGNKVEILSSQWDFTQGAWQLSERFDNVHDTNGHLLRTTVSYWSVSDSA